MTMTFIRACFGICWVATACLCCAACGGNAPTSNNQSGGASTSAAVSSASNTDADATGQSADMSKLDAQIAQLEQQAEASPDDDTARVALADAYVRRGNALHDAHRLMDALRDYQSALKFSPDHEEANLRAAQITQEIGAEPHAEDGKPVSVPAKPEPNN